MCDHQRDSNSYSLADSILIDSECNFHEHLASVFLWLFRSTDFIRNPLKYSALRDADNSLSSGNTII
jgi:hypothetical protein